jgi:hypothetical protein
MKRTIWRTVPFTNGFMQLSIDGRVRKVKNKTAFYGEELINGLIYEEVFPCKQELFKGINIESPILKFTQNGERVSKYLSVLMFETFHGILNLSYNNIIAANGNFLDVSLSNLLLCCKDDFYTYLQFACLENEKRYIENGKSSKQFLTRFSGMISAYNGSGMLVKHYTSAAQFSKENQYNSSRVRNHLASHKGSILDGKYLLLYGHGPSDIDVSLLQRMDRRYFNSTSSFNYQIVRCYNEKGKLEKVYNNIFEASIDANFEFDDFHSKIKKNGSLFQNNKIWMVDRLKRD